MSNDCVKNEESEENEKTEEANNSVIVEEIEGEDSAQNPTKKIREKLNKCVEEKKEYLDGWQRARADLINSKREFESSKKDLIKFANENMLHELIIVLDSFDVAFSDKHSWEKVDENWKVGMENIYSKFLSVFKNNGVEIINPTIGEKFNPLFHISIENVNVDSENKDGVVLEVAQKGYNLNGKNIRPARVKVGRLAVNSQ